MHRRDHASTIADGRGNPFDRSHTRISYGEDPLAFVSSG
jgi:hypothetical protein